MSKYQAPNNANDNLNQFNLMQSEHPTPQHTTNLSVSVIISDISGGDGSLYNVGWELHHHHPLGISGTMEIFHESECQWIQQLSGAQISK